MLFVVVFALVMFIVTVVVAKINNNALVVKVIKKINNNAPKYNHIDTSTAIDLGEQHYTDDDNYGYGLNITPKTPKFDVHDTVHGNYTYDTMYTDDNDVVLDMCVAVPKADRSYEYNYKSEHARSNYSRIHKHNKVNRAACRAPHKQYDESYMEECEA